eukprot:TRINITY_DN6136_c0_g1_i6.p1 TRINITY_DN6136_c0_g1~~TRINITY_DN6136_c0_g1_i6.p1  ORF type:complete len:1310 (+),score=449.97 TRINITY_DN6136_c0_g1_i6:125-4054(+)
MTTVGADGGQAEGPFPLQPRPAKEDVAYRALRERLNNLRYYQPLTQESAPLAGQLLGDLLRSADNFRHVQKKLDDDVRNRKLWEQEIAALGEENQRLLQENTLLHQKRVEDSHEQDVQKRRLVERIDVAKARLLHVEALQMQETNRTAEMKEAVGRLRSYISDVERMTPPAGSAAPGHLQFQRGGATSSSSRQRRAGGAPAVLIQGAPFRPGKLPRAATAANEAPGRAARAAQGSHDEDVDLQSLAERLSAARKRRAAESERLQAALHSVDQAESTLRRLGDTTSGEDGPTPGQEEEPTKVLQPQVLESELAFLRRTRETLEKRAAELSTTLAHSGNRRKRTEAEVKQLKQELAGLLRIAQSGAAVAASPEAAADHLEKRAALQSKIREASAEQLQLQAACQELEARLADARELTSPAAAGRREEHLEAMQTRLREAGRARPSEELAELERRFQELRADVLATEARCSQEATSLKSLQMQSAAQEQLLRTRSEEVSASKSATQSGELAAAGLDVRLRELEAAVQAGRVEAETLQECLATASLKNEEAERDYEDAREASGALRGQAASCEAEQASFETRVDQARQGALLVEAQAAEVRQREEQLLAALSGKLRRDLAFSEERLSDVQRRHRELSLSVNDAVSELVRCTAEQRAETNEDAALVLRIHQVGEQAEASAQSQERVLAQHLTDERQLEEALQVLRRGLEGLIAEDVAKQETSARALASLEPALDDARRELMAICDGEGGDGGAGRSTVDVERQRVAAAAAAAEREGELLKLQNALLLAEEERSALDARSATVRRHVEDLSALGQRLQRELEQRRASISQGGDCEANVAAELAEDAQSKAKALALSEASAEVAEQRLSALREAGHAAEDGLRDLEARQAQLGSLLRGLEATREQLALQLRDATDMLAEEKRLKENAFSGPAGVRSQLAQLSAEAERLRQAIQAVDAELSEFDQVASGSGAELRALREQLRQLQASGLDSQRCVDRLRHDVDMQLCELADSGQESQRDRSSLKRLRDEVESAEAEARRSQQEAALGLDDLLHMTRENQILHDELLQLRRQEELLQARSEEQQVAEIPRAQLLQGTYMEREHVVRAYQQAIEERQRNEVAIANLEESSQAALHNKELLQAKVAGLWAEEAQVRERMLSRHAELLTLRAQFSTATRSLQLCEVADGELDVQRTRKQAVISRQQAAMSEAYLKDADGAAAVEALRADVEQLQGDLTGLQASIAGSRREKEETLRRQLELQALLSQQRQVQQQLESENVLLRGLVGSAGREGAEPTPRHGHKASPRLASDGLLTAPPSVG